MKELIRKIFRGDAILWATILSLFMISGLVMFSAISSSAHRYDDYLIPFWGHMRHILLGIIIIIVVHQFSYRSIRWLLYLIPLASLLLLILTPIIGKEVNGAVRSIPIMGFEIQSIELTKLAIVIVFAEILGFYNTHTDKVMSWKTFTIMSGILGLFCTLVLVQNFSTAAMLFLVSILMMLVGKVSLKYIGTLLGGITAVGVLVICIILLIGPDKLGNDNRLGTWVKRVERFFETKEADDKSTIVITDENRQVVNSKIAIANGISPCGPGNSVQRDYLALAYSDFVYAVIIEEYGILGGIIIILLYVIILARAGKIARRCAPNEATESILVIGISLIIVMQAFINMSVATELGPTTGQNLPLISRGGMSMLVTSLAFGLILGISARNEERIQKEIAKQEAEQAEASTPIEESTEEANNQ